MRTQTSRDRGLRLLAFLATALILPACNRIAPVSGSLSPVYLTGVAALGAPLASRTVTIKDRNGNSVTATTAVDGRYSANVAGLTPPFLMKVDYTVPAPGTLYSVAPQPGTANLTPFTNLMVVDFFRVQSRVPATEFAGLNVTTPLPSDSQLGILEGVVRDTLALWFPTAVPPIDPVTFDPIRSGFLADGSGIDGILDRTTITDNGTTISVVIVDNNAAPTITQTTNVTVNTTTSETTAATTTVAPAGTSTSSSTTVVPTTNPQQVAVDGAIATFTQFKNAVNAQGLALADTDLLPFCDVNLLDDGKDRAWFAGETAQFLRGKTINSFSVDTVHSYDSVNKIVDVTFNVYISQGGSPQEQDTLRIQFKLDVPSGNWLIYGNRKIAEVGVQVEMRMDSTSGGVTFAPVVNVDTRGLVGTISSVKVYDTAGIFAAAPGTALTMGSTTEVVTFDPTPGGPTTTKLRDTYFAISGPLGAFPPTGTVFTVVVTPTVGSPQSYTVTNRSSTTEAPIDCTPPGHNLAADGQLGATLSVTWTLPTTFALTHVKCAVNLQSATKSQQVASSFTSPASTSATVVMPTMISGEVVTSASIEVVFEGPNGERINIQHLLN